MEWNINPSEADLTLKVGLESLCRQEAESGAGTPSLAEGGSTRPSCQADSDGARDASQPSFGLCHLLAWSGLLNLVWDMVEILSYHYMKNLQHITDQGKGDQTCGQLDKINLRAASGQHLPH